MKIKCHSGVNDERHEFSETQIKRKYSHLCTKSTILKYMGLENLKIQIEAAPGKSQNSLQLSQI